MPRAMEVGLSPGDFVLDGDPAPLLKMVAESPNFRPMSIVAVCIRIPLGTKIGLSLDDIVLDEDAAPLP